MSISRGDVPADERAGSGPEGSASEEAPESPPGQRDADSAQGRDRGPEPAASDSEPSVGAGSDTAIDDPASAGSSRRDDDGTAEGAAEPAPDTPPASGGAGSGRISRWKHRVALVLILPIACAIFGYAVYELVTWPDIERLVTQRPETTAFIDRYRERRREAGRSVEPSWRWVPYSQISPHLKRTVVAAEDISFFFHRGFDVEEIEMAIRDALAGRRHLRGASTITQQLAKNLWLSPTRNPWRKLKEAALTRQLERSLSKQTILGLYLNVVEFGPGIYGAEAAARHYFGKPAAELSEWESAQLAASLPRPSRWNPRSESRAYWSYVEDILQRLEKAEFLWRYIPPD